MKNSEVIQHVADVLSKPGAWVRSPGNGVDTFCIITAVYKVLGESQLLSTKYTIFKYIERALKKRYNVAYYIGEYNDVLSKDLDDVLDTLKLAKKLAMKNELYESILQPIKNFF